MNFVSSLEYMNPQNLHRHESTCECALSHAEQQIKGYTERKRPDERDQKDVKRVTDRSFIWPTGLWALVQMSPEQFLFVNVLFQKPC